MTRGSVLKEARKSVATALKLTARKGSSESPSEIKAVEVVLHVAEEKIASVPNRLDVHIPDESIWYKLQQDPLFSFLRNDGLLTGDKLFDAATPTFAFIEKFERQDDLNLILRPQFAKRASKETVKSSNGDTLLSTARGFIQNNYKPSRLKIANGGFHNAASHRLTNGAKTSRGYENDKDAPVALTGKYYDYRMNSPDAVNSKQFHSELPMPSMEQDKPTSRRIVDDDADIDNLNDNLQQILRSPQKLKPSTNNFRRALADAAHFSKPGCVSRQGFHDPITDKQTLHGSSSHGVQRTDSDIWCEIPCVSEHVEVGSIRDLPPTPDSLPLAGIALPPALLHVPKVGKTPIGLLNEGSDILGPANHNMSHLHGAVSRPLNRNLRTSTNPTLLKEEYLALQRDNTNFGWDPQNDPRIHSGHPILENRTSWDHARYSHDLHRSPSRSLDASPARSNYADLPTADEGLEYPEWLMRIPGADKPNMDEALDAVMFGDSVILRYITGPRCIDGYRRNPAYVRNNERYSSELGGLVYRSQGREYAVWCPEAPFVQSPTRLSDVDDGSYDNGSSSQ